LLAAWADIPVAETEEIYPTAETGDDSHLLLSDGQPQCILYEQAFWLGVSSERAPQLVSLAQHQAPPPSALDKESQDALAIS
jgi:hypothetical protein